MRCPRCGRENVKDAKFCVYCHQLFGMPANIQRPVAVSAGSGAMQKKSSKSMIIAIGSMGVLLVILLATILVLALSSGNGKVRSGGGGGMSNGFSSSSSSSFGSYPQSSGGSTVREDVTLSFSRNDIKTGTGTSKVYVYADTGLTGTAVTLYDEEGNAVAEMYDNGQVGTNGDEAADDGIYSAAIDVSIANQTSYYYYAQIDGSSKKSDVAKLSVMAPLTYAELSGVRKVDTGFEQLRMDVDYAYMTTAERESMVRSMLDGFAASGLVDADSIHVDYETGLLTYYYACGIMGGEFIGGIDSANNGLSNITNNSTFGNLPGLGTAANDTDFEGDAIFLYATDGLASARYPVVQTLVEDWTSRGLDTSLDSSVTIDDFKKLSGYDFVCIDAHGSYCIFDYNESMTHLWYNGLDKYEKSGELAIPLVFTLETVSAAKDAQYAEDLKAGRIMKIGGHYGIAPSFFDKYYDCDDIEGTIFYFTCCQFMGAFGHRNEEWADVLVSKDVDALIGYHNSVYAGYCYDKLSSFVPDLINGATVQQALDNAKHLYGSDDGKWYSSRSLGGVGHSDVAYPVIKGDTGAGLGDLVPEKEYSGALKSKGIDFGDAFYHSVAGEYNAN